jgi:membrane fusion protein, multidrug efflux system
MTLRFGASALLFGGLLGGLAGCGGHHSESAQKSDSAPKPVIVTVAPLQHRPVLRTIDVVGTLRGWEEVTIGAKREGRVWKVLHDMGDHVAPGEPLVRLESEDLDLEVQQAERQLQAELAKLGLRDVPGGEFDVSTVPSVVQAHVALDRARQNLARERSLIQRNAGAMQDFQNAENDERSAEAALANAILSVRSTLVGSQAMRVMLAVSRHKRSEMEVHVPTPTATPEGISGPLTYAIAKRNASEGQMLKQGDAIAELVIENPLRLRVTVPERNSVDVKHGQMVGLTVASHPGTTFEGKIARINPKIDDTTRTFQVEAVVPNNGGLLHPGGFAKASIVISRNADATVVPIESVSTYAGVTKIFVVEGDKVRSIPVETGLQGDGWVEVIGDLPAEAQVVTTGQVGLASLAQLAEGTQVVVRSPEPGPLEAGKSSTASAPHQGDESKPIARADRHPG